MDLHSIFAILAFVFSLAFYVPYVRSLIATSEVRPTISAWISWVSMDAAILAGMIAAHQIAWQMVAYIVGSIAVIGICIYKKASLGWTRLDTTCVVLTAIAILLWSVTGNPDADIVLSNIAITIGSVPFFVNIWQEPSREPLMPWILIWIGGMFGVAAIGQWSIAGALTPIWYLIVQTSAVFVIARKFRSRLAFGGD